MRNCSYFKRLNLLKTWIICVIKFFNTFLNGRIFKKKFLVSNSSSNDNIMRYFLLLINFKSSLIWILKAEQFFFYNLYFFSIKVYYWNILRPVFQLLNLLSFSFRQYLEFSISVKFYMHATKYSIQTLIHTWILKSSI